MSGDLNSSVVPLLALIVAVVALGIAIALTFRLAKLNRGYSLLTSHDDTATFVEVVAGNVQAMDELRDDVGAMRSEIKRLRYELGDAVRHVSVVRYDAFNDLAGRLSFSAALLDDGANGLVMTSIHARTETRLYIKGVRAGESDHQLSPEERQAVDVAMGQGR
ncbi:MAG: DUF4446 family protein [Actinobacteria bacterium]|nr:DUF4446 family protein [Actinomycetota bacterium]